MSVFVSTGLISPSGAPCFDMKLKVKRKTVQIQEDPYDSKGYTHTPPRREARF